MQYFAFIWKMPERYAIQFAKKEICIYKCQNDKNNNKNMYKLLLLSNISQV